MISSKCCSPSTFVMAVRGFGSPMAPSAAPPRSRIHSSELASRRSAASVVCCSVTCALERVEDVPVDVVFGEWPNGAPSMAELAVSLQTRHQSAVELVDGAVEAGLLARTTDPDDGRLRRLVLSTPGLNILESLSAVHRDELRRFHAGARTHP